jgi:hypothetical protein
MWRHILTRRVNMRVLRLLALLATGAAVTAVAAPVASAEKPIRFPLPPPPSTLPADICGFPIDVQTLSINETGTVFSNGIFMANGKLKVRLTNGSDPTKSVDLNISGPGKLIPQPDGTTLVKAEGASFFFFFPGQLASGSPGALLLVHGLATELIDANGNPVPGSFNPTGDVQDVCAMLT